MPPIAPPDMRVFDRTIARDHALYDGALVRAFGEYSNWTESTLQGPPFTIEHFRHHTRGKLVEFFRHVPDEGLGAGIARQDFSDRRVFLQHVAHCFVRLWGLDIHVCQNDIQEVLRCLRINLSEVIRTKKLPVIFENNPLRSHHTAKYEPTEEGMQPFIRMKEDDMALARYLAGPEPHLFGSPAINQHTLDILGNVQPFLTNIDDTHIHRTLFGLRQQLRATLAEGTVQTTEPQQHLLRLIVDDWEMTHSSEQNAALLDTIEAEMAEETGIAHLLNQPPALILERCFSDLLSAEPLDETAQKTLLRRKPILEFLLCSALKRQEGCSEAERNAQLKFFREAVLPTVRSCFLKLHLNLRDLGHLGLILATHAQDVSAEELLNRYLV